VYKQQKKATIAEHTNTMYTNIRTCTLWNFYKNSSGDEKTERHIVWITGV